MQFSKSTLLWEFKFSFLIILAKKLSRTCIFYLVSLTFAPPLVSRDVRDPTMALCMDSSCKVGVQNQLPINSLMNRKTPVSLQSQNVADLSCPDAGHPGCGGGVCGSDRLLWKDRTGDYD